VSDLVPLVSGGTGARIGRANPKLKKGFTMYTFNISLSQLKALSLHAADKKDNRYMLQGLHFAPGLSTVKAVATNGHVLVALDIGPFEGVAGEGFTMPADLLARFTKFTKREADNTLSIVYTPNSGVIRCNLLGQVTEQQAVDARFPDWQRVIRGAMESAKNAQADTVAFNTDYISALGDSARLASLGNVFIHQRGQNGALVQFSSPDAVGVLMALREESPGPLRVSDGFQFSRDDLLKREKESMLSEAVAA